MKIGIANRLFFPPVTTCKKPSGCLFTPTQVPVCFLPPGCCTPVCLLLRISPLASCRRFAGARPLSRFAPERSSNHLVVCPIAVPRRPSVVRAPALVRFLDYVQNDKRISHEKRNVFHDHHQHQHNSPEPARGRRATKSLRFLAFSHSSLAAMLLFASSCLTQVFRGWPRGRVQSGLG